LVELEQQFAVWHSGKISAGDLSDRIYAFSRGPARTLWSRYNARMDDTQVAWAIVRGFLPRDEMPVELLEALQPLIELYERDEAEQCSE
jgi:hypothetical protein